MNEMLAKKASDFAGEKQHSGVAPLPGGGLILLSLPSILHVLPTHCLAVAVSFFSFHLVTQMNHLGQSGLLSATSVQLTTSNYYFAKPNELTIVVNVIGNVTRPGRYEISKSIDLVNLIALAGGATVDGTLSEIKITRLLEAEGRITRGEFEVDLDEIAKVKPQDLVLSPGDVVQIGYSSWTTWRDVFTVLVSAAVIVTAVSYVAIARQ
jgi:hypothetical protein